MGMTTFTKIRYSDKLNFNEILLWCRNNCQDKFYFSKDWDGFIYGIGFPAIQFADEQDALLFALRWA